MTFRGTQYPKEADVRKAIELTASQINSEIAAERADAKFGAIVTLYRRKFRPSESRLLDLRKELLEHLGTHREPVLTCLRWLGKQPRVRLQFAAD